MAQLVFIDHRGNGRSEDGPQEELLGVWPFEYRITIEDEAIVEEVAVGFAEPIAIAGTVPILPLARVRDGDEGLQDRVDAGIGGEAFTEVVEQLLDGRDSNLAVFFEDGINISTRGGLESEFLTAFAGIPPDLQGNQVTAFQLDLTQTVIEEAPLETEMKPGTVEGSLLLGTRFDIRGQVRILGFSPPTE